MLKQIEELLCQKRHLSERLVGWSLKQYLHLIGYVQYEYLRALLRREFNSDF